MKWFLRKSLVSVSKMVIESVDFEDPLPTNLTELRSRNNRIFYRMDKESMAPLNEDEIEELIDSGFGGLARFIVQNWVLENGPDVESLQLLVRTGDLTISSRQYLDWCDELLELDQNNELALESLLFHQARSMKTENSEEIAEKLLRINPKNSGGRRHKIITLIENGSFDKALELCEDIIQQDSSNIFALRQRGIICTHMGNYKDAAFFWSEWLETDKAPVGDWFRAARAHYNARHFSECILLLEEILEEFSEEEKLLDLLIRAKYSIFDWNSCFDLCQEMLKLNSRNSTGLKYSRLTRARVSNKMTVFSEKGSDSLAYSSGQPFLSWFEYL